MHSPSKIPRFHRTERPKQLEKTLEKKEARANDQFRHSHLSAFASDPGFSPGKASLHLPPWLAGSNPSAVKMNISSLALLLRVLCISVSHSIRTEKEDLDATTRNANAAARARRINRLE
jgi:hypothetical protein